MKREGTLRRVFVVGPATGGLGKTFTVEVLGCIADAVGWSTILVDTDAAAYSLEDRLGETHGVIKQPWTMLNRGSARALHAEARSRGADTLVVDLAAGAQLVPDVFDFITALFAEAKRAGATPLYLNVLSPIKPGSEREPSRVLQCFGTLATVVLITNNRDGSGEFPPIDVDLPRAPLPFVMPGIMAARLLRRAPLLTVLSQPPSGYMRAMALLAAGLSEVIAVDAWTKVLGREATISAAGQLRSLSAAAPKLWYAGRTTLASVADQMLTADEAFLHIEGRLKRLRVDATDSELAAVLREYLAAVAARKMTA